MTEETVNLRSRKLPLSDSLRNSENFLKYLSTLAIPESFILLHPYGQLPAKALLEKTIPGLPGYKLSTFAQQTEVKFSLRLNSAELLLPIAHLANEINPLTKLPSTWSAYFAKAGVGGLLPLHHDTHDAYVFQLFGSRTWQVNGQDYELQPGSILFIPRGVVHQVIETKEDSLHITLGHHFPNLHSLMTEFIEKSRREKWTLAIIEDQVDFEKKLHDWLLKYVSKK